MARLTDKSILITGAGTGIGKESAQVLAAQGAKVVVTGYTVEEAAAVADLITARGGKAISLALDVTDEEQIRRAVDATVSAFGSLDVLINNAALTHPVWRAKDTDVINGDVEAWSRIMAVNLYGPMLTCKYAVPQMIKQGSGSIINISSGMGMLGEMTQTAYGASKAGVNLLTKYVATQYGKQGIRCNALTLGFVLSDTAKEAIAMAPGLEDIFLASHLTPFLGKPKHVADVLAFLASEESVFITGAVMPVDGGFSAHQPSYAQMKELFAAAGEAKF